MTDLDPDDYARSTITGRLWGHSTRIDHTSQWVKVRLHGNIKIIEGRDHVFFVPIESTARQKIVDSGTHPDA